MYATQLSIVYTYDLFGNIYGVHFRDNFTECCMQNWSEILSFCHNRNPRWVLKGNNDGYCLQIDENLSTGLKIQHFKVI